MAQPGQISLDEMINNFYDGIKQNKINGLSYRTNQETYAHDIGDVIENKYILIDEAGTGIGKTIGYLIPILLKIKHNKHFSNIVISTSSISLQNQLLEDIKKLTRILGLKININNEFYNKYGVLNINIDKGANNYLCLDRLNNFSINKFSKKFQKQIDSIIKKYNNNDSAIDKDDLTKEEQKVWEYIKLNSKTYCLKCYNKECPLIYHHKNLEDSDIIITNHANLFASLNNQVYENMNMLVLDEGHKIFEMAQIVDEKNLSSSFIINLIKNIANACNINITTNDIRYFHNTSKRDSITDKNKKDFLILIYNIEWLYIKIKKSAAKEYEENNKKIKSLVDCTKLKFKFNKEISLELNNLIKTLNKLLQKITNFKISSKLKDDLKYCINILSDINKACEQEENENIYWVDFTNENNISIGYFKRKSDSISKTLEKEIPIVITSATLKEAIGDIISCIPNNRSYYFEMPKPSPYNIKDNTILYYNDDDNLPSIYDYDNYIMYLALNISELIKITEGKTLILFTSKKVMNDVYELIKLEKYDFDIYLQNDSNTYELKRKFEKNTNSCLFATGVFWEGIDIKGPSLSSVIISQLPFDIVNAVTADKLEGYNRKEDRQKIITNSMMLKLRQGIGRLIRCETDAGIVSILDSRCKEYLEPISTIIPIENFTTDRKALYNFLVSKKPIKK